MTPHPLRRPEAAALLLALAELAAATGVWRFGPPRIATHYGLNGAPDRWSTPAEAAVAMVLVAACVLAGVAALGVAARRPWADDARRRGLGVAQGLLAGVGAAVVALVAVGVLSTGAHPGAAAAVPVMTSLMILGVGLVLGRVPPNALVGVRTPWSLSSRLAWDKSNRLAGRLMLAGGALGLAAAMALPASQATPLIVAAALAAAGAAVFESWRVWRADPERRAV